MIRSCYNVTCCDVNLTLFKRIVCISSSSDDAGLGGNMNCVWVQSFWWRSTLSGDHCSFHFHITEKFRDFRHPSKFSHSNVCPRFCGLDSRFCCRRAAVILNDEFKRCIELRAGKTRFNSACNFNSLRKVCFAACFDLHLIYWERTRAVALPRFRTEVTDLTIVFWINPSDSTAKGLREVLPEKTVINFFFTNRICAGVNGYQCFAIWEFVRSD